MPWRLWYNIFSNEETMKNYRFFLNIFLIGLLWAGTNALAASDTFTTGKDWTEKMSEKEKFISIVAPMVHYSHYGVPFQHTPPEYVSVIDRVLLYNPYLEKEDMANIFASTVYAFEPESRPAFENLNREAEYRRTGLPLLTIKHLPEMKDSQEST
jgi:hypothetical protein